jgi:hypothetical protein
MVELGRDENRLFLCVSERKPKELSAVVER